MMDDETIARWSRLLHCVEIDAAGSDPTLLKRVGGSNVPFFAVLDKDLNVVATSASLKSRKAVVAFLKKAVTKKVEGYWPTIKTQLAQQQTNLESARKLVKAKKLDEALKTFEQIRRSPLRIGEWWDKAAGEHYRLEQRLQREK